MNHPVYMQVGILCTTTTTTTTYYDILPLEDSYSILTDTLRGRKKFRIKQKPPLK